MTRRAFSFVLLYALILQWPLIPQLRGIPVAGELSAMFFLILWIGAAICALIAQTKSRDAFRASVVVFLIKVSISLAVYAADIGAHSRDVPIVWHVVSSFIFSLFFTSPLLTPSVVKAIGKR